MAEAFRNAFCVPTQSAVEKYFSLKQRRGETPRQHLWRLNAAAKKARIRLTTPADLKHHVGRFLKSLTDSEVRTVLIGRTFKTLEDLEATLKAYEEHASYGDDPRSRSTPSRERERSVPRSGQVYYTYDSDQEASWDREPKTVRFKVDERYDDDSDVDDLEDGTEVVYQAVADRSQERRGWQGPQSSGDGGPPPHRQAPSSRYETRQARPREHGPREHSPGPRRDPSKCFECGGTGHWASDCPSRVVCTMCKTPGHPAESCRKLCPACNKVHQPGECPKVKALEALKTWAVAEENAAIASQLPAAVQQHLN
ncbi:hypothetical protein P43SY_012064 [Pythium insidiosum]|uniref:CCHC-type domain-containing protein n=1 Tax=Pythium insidiosum TaxID=114742 RepID=A0AAD5Q4X8_PYTIN|nr:hypothetical protein P43SY_012064 [Pythium insidiosum]